MRALFNVLALEEREYLKLNTLLEINNLEVFHTLEMAMIL